MDALIVPEIEERGLTLGLDALTPHERDVFVIYDLHLYYEMEGCFADHVPNFVSNLVDLCYHQFSLE